MSTTTTNPLAGPFGEAVGTIWACEDCTVAHCNGEFAHSGVWSRLDDGESVTAGLMWEEHTCGRESSWDGEECDCEHREVSSVICESCGTHLDGYRHAFTLWVDEMAD
jgi:hypothetical protein